MESMAALASGLAEKSVPFMRLVRHDPSSPYYGYIYQGRTPLNGREYRDSQLDPAFCSQPEVATPEETVCIRSAKADEAAPAEDEIPGSLKYARWLAQQTMPTPARYPWFVDTVSVWVEAFPQVAPNYIDASEDSFDVEDDAHEADVGPIQAQYDALEDANRSGYILRIYRLTGVYLGDDISPTVDLWDLLVEIKSCLFKYRKAA